jgi:energy-coupling factor transport system permease protein
VSRGTLTAPPAAGASLEHGRLARANPAAKILAAGLLGVGLLVAVDPVTAAVALAVELVALRLGGVPLGLLARRAWPLALSAAGVGITNVLLGEGGSPEIAGLGAALRVIAVALPGVAILLTVDPTDLADSLVQQWRVPPRFAYGALAALRLLPLLAGEWRTIALARRARGADPGRNPLARVRAFAGQVFTLLVGAVRRGTRLALAMDARGFDSTAERTVARPQRVRATDRWLVVGAAAVPVFAVLTSAAIGTFRPLWG